MWGFFCIISYIQASSKVKVEGCLLASLLHISPVKYPPHIIQNTHTHTHANKKITIFFWSWSWNALYYINMYDFGRHSNHTTDTDKYKCFTKGLLKVSCGLLVWNSTTPVAGRTVVSHTTQPFLKKLIKSEVFTLVMTGVRCVKYLMLLKAILQNVGPQNDKYWCPRHCLSWSFSPQFFLFMDLFI